MDVQVKKAFLKDARSLPTNVQHNIQTIITQIRDLENITQIQNLKPLKGHSDRYRIRLGDYRIGLHILDNIATFEAVDKRGDFYKTYPPD